jgi:hypothetical protein
MTQIMSQTKGPEDQQLQGQQLQGAKRPWSKPTLTAVDIKANTHLGGGPNFDVGDNPAS